MNKLNKAVLKDAKKMAGGMYHLNASDADRYGFTEAANGKEVGYGEFLFRGETEKRVDWIIELQTGEVREAVVE